MPQPDNERYQALNNLHAAFCDEMDKPGISDKKRIALAEIADRMKAYEPEGFWKNQILSTLQCAFQIFDIADRTRNPHEYDDAKNKLRVHLEGLHMHIDSLRPRDY